MDAMQSALSDRGVLPLRRDFLARFSTLERAWEALLNEDLDADPDAEAAADREVRLVQVEDVANVGSTDPSEEQKPSPTRTLALALSDGRRRLTAVEFESLPFLSVSTLPGTKLMLTRPLLRRGCLLLTERDTQILPSFVPSLADQRRDRPAPDRGPSAIDLGGIAALADEDNQDDGQGGDADADADADAGLRTIEPVPPPQ